MIDRLLNSATSGFGASFGRDLYKWVKKNPLILVLIGIALVAVGWRGFYTGIGRSGAYRFFVTFLGSLLMVVIGTFLFLLVGSIYSDKQNAGPFIVALGCVILAAIGGNLWGFSARKKRKAIIAIKKQNIEFLQEIGLSDSAFDTNLLEDREGNLLKLIEQTSEKIVFSVSGRRGLRAAISLNNGHMSNYSGIVKI